MLVRNASELKAALGAAKGGETILLRGGDYGNFNYGGKSFAATVTIRSEDPEALARFEKITLTHVSNLSIDRVEVDPVPTETSMVRDPAVRFWEVKNVALTNSILEGGEAINGVPPETPRGGLDSSGNVLGLPTGRAVTVLGGENLVFSGNEISKFFDGIVLANVDGVTISDNEIHHLRITPLRGGAVSDVVVDGNYFHHSTPWQYGGNGDHGNQIHFWTRPGQDGASENITITDNVFLQGAGYALMGIQIDDNGNRIGFENVVIENNVLHGGHRSGIWFENTHDSVVANNTLLQATGGVTNAPGICLWDGSSDVEIRDNITGHVTVSPNSSDISIDGNLIPQKIDSKGANYYGDLFVNPMAEVPELSDLQALPGSLVTRLGVGSSFTRFDARPDQLIAAIRPEVNSDDDYIRNFDARLTANAGGFVTANGAKFHWDFGDGTMAEGIEVTHRYAKPGDYPVTLRVTHKDGSVDEAHTLADVNGPYLLKLDVTASGVVDESGYRSPVTVSKGAAEIVKTAEGYAYRLNDANDLIVPTTERQLYGLDEFSLSFAIEREALSGDDGTIARMHGSWYLWLEKNGELAFSMTNAEGTWFGMTTVGAEIDDTDRHAVTLTFDGEAGEAVLYVDGRAAGEMAVAGETQPLESWGLTIGNHTGGNFNGLMDDFEIYGKARSAEEVLDLHEQLVAGKAPWTDYEPAPDPGPAPQPKPKPEPEPTPVAEAIYRWNAGTKTIAAADGGPDWIADAGAIVGSGKVAASPIETSGTLDVSIPDATPAGIFAQELYGNSASRGLGLEFGDGELEAGSYAVRLYMGDGFKRTDDPGERVFDVHVEGELFLDDLDLTAVLGHRTAGVFEWRGDVDDGTIDIDFGHVIENPLINAVEIIRIGGVEPISGETSSSSFDDTMSDDLLLATADQASGQDIIG